MQKRYIDLQPPSKLFQAKLAWIVCILATNKHCLSALELRKLEPKGADYCHYIIHSYLTSL